MQNLTDQPLPDQLRDAASAVARIGDGAAGYAALSDADLLESQTQLGLIRRSYETHAAWAAGEIARRSSRELGFSGLAQRNGFLSPVELIQSATGGTRAEAVKLVAVGTLLNQTESNEELQHELRQAGPDATTPANASTSAATNASSPRDSEQVWLPATAAAAGPAARNPRPGRRRTTSTIGKPNTAKPISPTASCSAAPTTCSCTTTTGTSGAPEPTTGSFHRSPSTRPRHPSRCRAKTR